ncbi:MAG: branched-chain amino acid ABC transporter permease [Xanthobacteraceae bacterium]|nr:branched-chain amino acid ABC transporter permease [Xanthobacteraceae bacterium]
MTDVTSQAPSPAQSGPAQSLGFYAIWAVCILGVILLPLIFTSGGSHTTFSLIGIAIIFALSYNILLGQTGLLSFGHAVYYGLGGFLAVHGMNAIVAHELPVPLPFVPLIGGFAGLVFALVIGWVSTQRAGTVFAMISLGVGELVASSSLILRSFFGGEAGITTNRTDLPTIFGLSFGPQIQVYYLIAFWLVISAIGMYALTRTPLGRMCNAVRDNPERVQFIGYDPHVVRYLAFCFAGFFAGIAGALAAINFEIANAAYLGAVQSGVVLFAAFIGGVSYFFGPILGAIVVTMLQLELADITSVWQLYFGIIFIGIVMFAPGGIASLLMMHRPLLRAGTLPMVLPSYLIAIVPTLLFACGVILGIEVLGAYSQGSADSTTIRLFRIPFEAASPMTWLAAVVLTIGGFFVARMTWRGIAGAWDRAAMAARERGYLS